LLGATKGEVRNLGMVDAGLAKKSAFGTLEEGKAVNSYVRNSGQETQFIGTRDRSMGGGMAPVEPALASHSGMRAASASPAALMDGAAPAAPTSPAASVEVAAPAATPIAPVDAPALNTPVALPSAELVASGEPAA